MMSEPLWVVEVEYDGEWGPVCAADYDPTGTREEGQEELELWKVNTWNKYRLRKYVRATP